MLDNTPTKGRIMTVEGTGTGVGVGEEMCEGYKGGKGLSF